jgi:hypothetical protein
MGKYYLYEHRTLNGELFYVGKGTFNIKYSYGGYQRAYSKQNRTKKWKEISKKGYKINIIFQSDDLQLILQKENELWENCSSCVNKQVTKNFKEYSIYKLDNDYCILHIFKNTYLIHKSGSIFNSRGKLLKCSDNGKGYKIITFSNGETVKKNMYVHRIIAECFLENPKKLNIVNHKDLNKNNNSVENLEWVTQQENVQHSVNLSSYVFKDKIKPIYQFNKDGQLLKEWDRASSIATFYNCTQELIQQACQQKNLKKGLTAKGYIWIYKEDFLKNNTQKFELTKLKYERAK